MARRLFKMTIGMKEHPETYEERNKHLKAAGKQLLEIPDGADPSKQHQLLFAGDVFECEEGLLMRMPSQGGWMEPTKWDDSTKEHRIIEFGVRMAVPVEDATGESFTLRDEPSQIIGVNVSPKEYAERQAAEEAQSSSIGPRLATAKSAPASVRRRG